MEIKNKELFRLQVKNKLEKYIKEFPLFFYGNMFINIILIVIIFGTAFFAANALQIDARISAYGILVVAGVSAVFRITFRSFLRNARILKDISEGNYRFGIEDHEMDNAIELMEDLPKNKEEIAQIKVALSFDKLIEVLVAARIITCHNDLYEIDLKFAYEFEKLEQKHFNMTEVR